MARGPRKRCESNVYHVVVRGVGRQRIFEDDADRRAFVDLLFSAARKQGVDVPAWCLMDNHVHMLLTADLDCVSKAMRSLETQYAQLFNSTHGHVGHVFQGRFKSVPVEDDPQLMAAVRYIHRNPVAAGLARDCGDWRWSSYLSYAKEPWDDADCVRGAFGTRAAFVSFHAEGEDDEGDPGHAEPRRRCGDSEALDLLNRTCGGAEALVVMGKVERDASIRRLKMSGLSVRQIERLTGIGRSIIQRA